MPSPPPLNFSNILDKPPPLGGDFLGEHYWLFERAVTIHSFCESNNILVALFLN